MKRIVWLLSVSAVAQQSTIETRTFDVNGSAVAGAGSIQSGSSTSQVFRNGNGRTVPLESVEDRVVSDAGGVRIVERLVKRYDANGSPGPAERVRIEERKEPDGSLRTLTTVSRADINGGFQLAERTLATTLVSGNRTDITSTVERPTLNGGFDVYEQTQRTAVSSGPKTTENVAVMRRDANGRMGDFARKTREAVTSNGTITESTAEFEAASTGQMKLMRQTSAEIEATGNRQVTLYLPDPQGKLVLSQQQTIQKSGSPNRSVETTTVRFALPNEPGRLGPPRKVQETVCAGSCGAKPQP